jgi:hypothetical protein
VGDRVVDVGSRRQHLDGAAHPATLSAETRHACSAWEHAFSRLCAPARLQSRGSKRDGDSRGCWPCRPTSTRRGRGHGHARERGKGPPARVSARSRRPARESPREPVESVPASLPAPVQDRGDRGDQPRARRGPVQVDLAWGFSREGAGRTRTPRWCPPPRPVPRRRPGSGCTPPARQ